MPKTTKAVKKSAAKASKQTAGKATKRRKGNSTTTRAFTFPPDFLEALQAARGSKEALAKFQNDPPSQIIAYLFFALTRLVNAQIPSVFTTQNLNLFGSPNNHLDPLNFNGRVSVQTSGDFCFPPRDCESILGVEICFPPWVPCVEGQASAGLDSLTGLSGARIIDFQIPFIDVWGNTASGLGTMQLAVPQLTGNGSASASGGPSGFSIPISASASATINKFIAYTEISFSCDLDPPKLTTCKIKKLVLSFDSINVSFGDFGPFSILMDALNSGLNWALIAYMSFQNSTDKELADALKDLLQNLIKSQLPVTLP